MENFMDKVIQGDCLELMKQMPDNCVDLVIADPPYNLSKGNSWKWDRSVSLPGMGGKWEKANESWDDQDFSQYFSFTLSWMSEVKRILKPEGSAWIFGSYHNSGVVNVACQLEGIEIINEVIWYKRNSFPNLSGRRLTASHETIIWCHSGGEKKRKYKFNYDESRYGDYAYDKLKVPDKQMRTVWDIPNNKERREIEHGKHPTQKPLRVIKRIIQLTSDKDDIVFTPFSGSGTECLAAKELGRHYIGFELEEEYVDLSRVRLSKANAGDLIRQSKSQVIRTDAVSSESTLFEMPE